MAEAVIQGTCDECGKVYRVPSADRTYTCKACGGSVRVAEGKPKPRSAQPARTAAVRRRRPAGDEGGGEDGDDAPRASRRRRTSSSSRSGWIILVVLLVVSGVGFGLWKSGLIAQAAGGEKDLGKVTESFKADWEAADLGDLADCYHPDGRREFRARLDTIAENRGWADGFPAIVQKTERVMEGTAEDPEKGMSMLTWGDEQDAVTVMWQFEPSRTRWFAYDVALTPSRLGPRVEAFREAWSQSNPEALHPFFRQDAREKMADLVARNAEKGGWAKAYPRLGDPEITGEEKARQPMARMLGGSRPESVFPLASGDGELLVKWSFRDEDDAWVVTGFKFP